MLALGVIKFMIITIPLSIPPSFFNNNFTIIVEKRNHQRIKWKSLLTERLAPVSFKPLEKSLQLAPIIAKIYEIAQQSFCMSEH